MSVYDGLGNRIRRDSGTVTHYLLDLQPGLAQVLAQTVGANTNRYIHGPRGIHAQQNSSGDWAWTMQDGLGSVRGLVSDMLGVEDVALYAPYGEPITDLTSTPFGYTGEQWDNETDLLYLRARHYAPEQGMFTALDPFEGVMDEPMSLNGYSYAHGNPVMNTDPSGQFINIIVGAIAGAVIGGALGALFGSTQAEITYHLAANGRCGCDKKDAVKRYGYSNFVRDFKRDGTVIGATLGSIFGAGGPVAALIGPALTAIGFAQSVDTVKRLADDFFDNWRVDNECLWVDFAFDLLDIAVGKGLEVGNRRRSSARGSGSSSDGVGKRRVIQLEDGTVVPGIELPNGNVLDLDGNLFDSIGELVGNVRTIPANMPAFLRPHIVEILAKIPPEWGDGMPNQHGVGWRWSDNYLRPNKSTEGLRIDMAQSPTARPNMSAQWVDHVVVRWDGKVLDANGDFLPGSLREFPEQGHIPLEIWLKWPSWNHR